MERGGWNIHRAGTNYLFEEERKVTDDQFNNNIEQCNDKLQKTARKNKKIKGRKI